MDVVFHSTSQHRKGEAEALTSRSTLPARALKTDERREVQPLLRFQWQLFQNVNLATLDCYSWRVNYSSQGVGGAILHIEGTVEADSCAQTLAVACAAPQ